MDTHWRLGTRTIACTSIAKGVAGVAGVAALAGIYPLAAAISTAMATSLRAEIPKPAAVMFVSAGAAERKSLGLRLVLSNPIREE